MHRALLQLLAALRRARLLGVDGRDVVPRGVESGERRHREGRRSHEGDAHGEGLWRRMGGGARLSLTPIVTPDLIRGDDGKGYCAPIAHPLPPLPWPPPKSKPSSRNRSEEHTSELQSLMHTSYA